MSPTTPNSPTFAIVGAGAIGTYYGGRFALVGKDVRFLLRSDRERVRAQGIRLVERERTLAVQPVQVFA